MNPRLLVPMVVSGLLQACASTPSATKTAGVSPPAPAPAGELRSPPPSPATASPPATGLSAPDNDGAIVAAAKAALACRFEDDDGFDGDCPGYVAWTNLEAPFEGGKNDATLVRMLEDDDKRVRLLGAMELEEHGEAYKTDKALADRVLTVAERETLEVVAVPLGGSIGEMDLAASGAFDRIAKLAKTHAQKEMRGRIVARLLDNNKTSDAAYALTAEMLSDASPDVRIAAVEALPRGAGHVADTCKTLGSVATGEADARIAATAARRLAHTKQCSEQYAPLLDALEARQKKPAGGHGALGYWYFCSALWNLCEDPKATAEMRKRAVAVAKKVADSKDEDQATRLESLDAIVRCDPSGGSAAFLSKLKADKDKQVADKAARLLAPKKSNGKSAL